MGQAGRQESLADKALATSSAEYNRHTSQAGPGKAVHRQSVQQ